MRKLFASLVVLASAFALSGCESEENIRLLANPSVIDIGVFDGCDVKFVDRGRDERSFYIARCGAAATQTTTSNFRQPQGKSSVFRRSTVIATEIEALKKEQAESEAIEKALAGVPKEKRAALGLE